MIDCKKCPECNAEKAINCPKCNVPMEKLTNGKYVIDKCPKCEGIFLDKAEVESINKQGFIRYVLSYFKRDKR